MRWILKKPIDRRENGLIKVVTGINRYGKSFLLFRLFYDYLKENGIPPKQIITIALDDDTFVRDPDELSKYIRAKIVNNEMYYILIDEVQYAISRDDEYSGLRDTSVRRFVVLPQLSVWRNFHKP